MDQDETTIPDRLLAIGRLESIKHLIDAPVPDNVDTDPPVKAIANRHQLLEALRRLLRDPMIVIVRIRVGVAHQRGPERHTAVVKDLDAGELQPIVAESGGRAVAAYDRFPGGIFRRRLRPEHQSDPERRLSRRRYALQRGDIAGGRRALDHAGDAV